MTLWIRVRDVETGHEFDVGAERFDMLLARGAVIEVADGRHNGGRPRPATHYTPPAPPAAKKTTRPTAAAEPTTSTLRDRSAP